MPRVKQIVLVAFPGAQVLDITGPASVFGAANAVARRRIYAIRIASRAGGVVPTSGGVSIATTQLRRVSVRGLHTLLVVGGSEKAVRAMMADRAAGRWIRRAAPSCARFGSVCSGAFVLAALGLLDGKRVTTHWEGYELLAQGFPRLTVDANALYVEDGRVWTSAGVTTGIDMALALVERDAGAAVAASVAQQLVLYARRPGFQSQFSPLLRAQLRADAPFSELVDWMQEHLGERLGVDELARRVRQSPRNFHRRFTAATGQSPARFVETLRLDRARSLLAHALSLKEVAGESGFGDPIRLGRAFQRRFGIRPSLFRQTQGPPRSAFAAPASS